MNRWLYQYLDDEKIYYLTEHHEEDGVLGEHFFENFNDLNEFVITNRIPILLSENSRISKVDNFEEDRFAKLRISTIKFDCLVTIYDGDDRLYKLEHNLTLDLIKCAPEAVLGAMLKDLTKKLENHIENESR